MDVWMVQKMLLPLRNWGEPAWPLHEAGQTSTFPKELRGTSLDPEGQIIQKIMKSVDDSSISRIEGPLDNATSIPCRTLKGRPSVVSQIQHQKIPVDLQIRIISMATVSSSLNICRTGDILQQRRPVCECQDARIRRWCRGDSALWNAR